jgi:hypothetical protein
MLVAVIGFLLTPLSTVVWRVVPEMAFLQFPWRLVAVLAAAVCTAIPIAVGTTRIRATTIIVSVPLLVVALTWPAVHGFRQECDNEDTVTARLGAFVTEAGTDPTDEYTPGEADNDALKHANPPFWLSDSADAVAPQGISGPVPMHFAVDANRSEMLMLNLRDYPAWRVRVNSVEVKAKTARADGLIAFPVAAGRSRIDIAYAMTEDRRAGDAVSLAALCASVVLAGLGRLRSRSPFGGRV